MKNKRKVWVRFINARRRIVQPMIDQSNRAGRAPAVSVFKNRRRNRSDQSPGPSPDLGAGYSPDAAAAVTMPMAYPGADIYNMQRTMFPTAPYSAFPNPSSDGEPFHASDGNDGLPVRRCCAVDGPQLAVVDTWYGGLRALIEAFDMPSDSCRAGLAVRAREPCRPLREVAPNAGSRRTIPNAVWVLEAAVLKHLGAGYSPDAAAAVTMPMAYPGADIYNMQRTMFPTAPYSAFPNPSSDGQPVYASDGNDGLPVRRCCAVDGPQLAVVDTWYGGLRALVEAFDMPSDSCRAGLVVRAREPCRPLREVAPNAGSRRISVA
ncbi:hypothetical protein ANCDUO_08579 [Ancylostoma duodenale]|uniref:Uncharacterized protein n=1 Tax=Ancylostoma duodenale TaxID=51022 RepID=A0A0C2GQ13_9BILA|nr:hypothetical protein ANCDUO_08579 [Ancylostoma duodenale]